MRNIRLQTLPVNRMNLYGHVQVLPPYYIFQNSKFTIFTHIYRGHFINYQFNLQKSAEILNRITILNQLFRIVEFYNKLDNWIFE